MKCPFCNQDNTRVVDSRPVEDTNSIRRRRLCDACGRRFTTYEKVESIPLTVIKKDQNREQYNRSKIQSGILRACYKRPISIDKIEEMMDAIEGEIFNTEEKEISSTRIGEIVMEHLKDLDAVAYVRFASVYREFKDVSTFMDELKKARPPPWRPWRSPGLGWGIQHIAAQDRAGHVFTRIAGGLFQLLHNIGQRDLADTKLFRQLFLVRDAAFQCRNGCCLLAAGCAAACSDSCRRICRTTPIMNNTH